MKRLVSRMLSWSMGLLRQSSIVSCSPRDRISRKSSKGEHMPASKEWIELTCSLLKMLRLSASLVTAISQAPLLEHLCASLSKPLKAVIKLNVLRLTKILYESHSDVRDLAKYGIREVVERLSRQDEAVLVRELAKEILPALPLSKSRVTSDKAKEKEPRVRTTSGPSTYTSASTSIPPRTNTPHRDRDPPRLSTAKTSSLASSSSSRAMPPPPIPEEAGSGLRGKIPELFRRVSPGSRLAIKGGSRDRERQRTDPGPTSFSMAMWDSSMSISDARSANLSAQSAREPLRPSMERSDSSDGGGGKKHKRTVSRSVK